MSTSQKDNSQQNEQGVSAEKKVQKPGHRILGILIQVYIFAEKMFRRMLYLMIVLLIVAVVWRTLYFYAHASITEIGWSDTDLVTTGSLEFWKKYRNLIQTLSVIDFFLLIPVALKHIYDQKFFGKNNSIWIFLKLWFFSTFSFALAGVIVDLFFATFFVHANLFGQAPEEVMKSFFSMVFGVR